MPSAWLGTFTGTPWSSSTLAPVPQEPLQGCKACKVHSRAQPRSDYVETVQWKTGAAILHVQGVVRARKQKQVVETVSDLCQTTTWKMWTLAITGIHLLHRNGRLGLSSNGLILQATNGMAWPLSALQFRATVALLSHYCVDGKCLGQWINAKNTLQETRVATGKARENINNYVEPQFSIIVLAMASHKLNLLRCQK